ncbi:MAG: hypothetical protein WD646_00790 [Actinomycetota bacterium]
MSQDGDNDSDVDVETEQTGGDGVAGGQVIGGAGISGDVTVTADNNSEFARARGGDATNELELDVDSGPKLEIEGDNINVEANATGVALVTQTAAPNVSITLSQFSNPSGEVLISNTATSLQNLSGTALISQTGSGTSSITQTFNQTGSSSVSNTVAPILTINGSNTANVTGSAPVTQSATAITNPTAIASVGSIDKNATLLQDGDNSSEFDPELILAAGDGVAGSQIMGLAGVSGSVNIDASNTSRFASGRGGDAESFIDASVDSGPQITLGGNTINVVANAEGVAIVSQTAAPVVTLDVEQVSSPTGQIVVDNTASAEGSGILSQTVASGGGVITQSVTQSGTQSGSSSVSNEVAPVLDINGSNNATVTGSAPVLQTATATTNPTATASFG